MDNILKCKIWKQGTANVITIPSKIMQFLNLKNGDEISIKIIKEEEDGKAL